MGESDSDRILSEKGWNMRDDRTFLSKEEYNWFQKGDSRMNLTCQIARSSVREAKVTATFKLLTVKRTEIEEN